MVSEDESAGEPITILLVEPSPGDSRLFAEQFEDAKLANTVYTVSDGEAALDFVYQRGEYTDHPSPDIILLDPRLPDMNGTDVLDTLDGEPALCEIPTVVLTSSAAEEGFVRSNGLDADAYIRKPVEPSEFIEFVQSVEEFWLTITHERADA